MFDPIVCKIKFFGNYNLFIIIDSNAYHASGKKGRPISPNCEQCGTGFVYNIVHIAI